jgi:hypothetical protein
LGDEGWFLLIQGTNPPNPGDRPFGEFSGYSSPAQVDVKRLIQFRAGICVVCMLVFRGDADTSVTCERNLVMMKSLAWGERHGQSYFDPLDIRTDS